jgi:EpsI family protein
VSRPSWWPPAAVLVIGALLATLGVRAQRTLPLRAPLAATVPDTVAGLRGRDLTLSTEEVRVAGVSDYLARVFAPDSVQRAAGAPAYVTLYVGYYESQTQGRTIHSPKNCLPGSGWEPLTSSTATVATDGGRVAVNRYLIQKGPEQALVLYWYQGRGRVAANEYLVKWHLLRDAALRRRSDEALVRLVVPIDSSESDALRLATDAARALIPAIYTSLPS